MQTNHIRKYKQAQIDSSSLKESLIYLTSVLRKVPEMSHVFQRNELGNFWTSKNQQITQKFLLGMGHLFPY